MPDFNRDLQPSCHASEVEAPVQGRYGYPPRRRVAVGLLQDLLLAGVLGALFVLQPTGPLALGLAVAIPLVMGWGILTLHFPSRVEIDDSGIAFFGYGRSHRFAWNELERVQVRRFLVRDRVLVRLVPAPPFHGRYWLLDSLQGYDALVRQLEARSSTRGALVNRTGSV